jgi:hypothetical protein
MTGTGNFDLGNVSATIGGLPLDNIMSIEFPRPSGLEARPLPGGGGRVLGHGKQSRANHHMVNVVVPYPSQDEARLQKLATDQTDTQFSFAITPTGVAELPDGELVSFTSAKVVVGHPDQAFSDEPGARTYSMSCIGYKKRFKNAPDIIRD